MEDYYKHYANPVQPRILPKSLQYLQNPSKDGCELSFLQQHCERSHTHDWSNWDPGSCGRIWDNTAISVPSLVLCESRKDNTVKHSCCYVYMCPHPSHIYCKEGVLPPNKSKHSCHQLGDRARQAYVTKTASRHGNQKVEQCGFIINPCFPEVVALPYGLIHCTCLGKGCLEIKCTFTHRH